MIRSENARLTGWVFVDIAGRDIGSYVAEAARIVREQVDLPAGYADRFGRAVRADDRGARALAVAIPAAVLIIFVLLMLHFGRWTAPRSSCCRCPSA